MILRRSFEYLLKLRLFIHFLIHEQILDGTVHNYTCRNVYDNAGNITALIGNTSKVTTYEYDYRNNVTAEIDPAGRITRYTYDEIGRLPLMTAMMLQKINHTLHLTATTRQEE